MERDGEGGVGRKLTLVTIEMHSGFILTNVIKLHLTLFFPVLCLQFLRGEKNTLFTAHLGPDSRPRPSPDPHDLTA